MGTAEARGEERGLGALARTGGAEEDATVMRRRWTLGPRASG